jgi:hypothetical protein
MMDRSGGRARPRVTAILGPFSSEPFALGLRTLLVESGDFDVISVDDPTAIGRDIAEGNPSILITEGTDPAVCQTYLELSVVRSVVLFDPVGARAFVGLENPDWQQLADVVKAAVGKIWTNPPAAMQDRICVIDPRTLSSVAAHGADSAALEPLIEWLELSLGLSLIRRVGQDATGVPGWSIAPREAFELLNLDPQSTTQADLSARLSAVDNALVVSRTSLPRAVAHIANVFLLSEVELRLLCLVLAPELDGRYATIIGVLQDDLTRRRPGLTLLAELMSPTGVDTWDLRRTVHASDSIVSEGLVRPGGTDGLPVDVGFAPSRAVVAHLLAPSVERAVAEVDAELQWPLPGDEPVLSAQETELARQLLQSMTTAPAVVHLVGGGHTKGWFSRVTAAIGLPLMVGDIEKVDPGPAQVAAVDDWGVLSRLVGSGLMVLGVDTLGAVERRRVAARLLQISRGGRLVATDGEPSVDRTLLVPGLLMRAPTISATQRAHWWSRAAARTGLALATDDIRRLAATAPIDPEDIDRSVAVAVRHGAAAGHSTVELVQRAARDLSPTPLPPGVRRIVPTYGWDDIVLAGPRKELLQAIPMHVLQAGRVLEEWGFASRMPYGQGVAALFSGPSGTGKTMAAQIIAGALGVDLLQVDLSKTVSKYIGETEKNLDGIFDAAERAGAVLLFDEADAIFGKRTEIKDAHDRHANVEVAYLLQRMESFRGLAILTTNFKQNIDEAFVRRLRFVVEFALPNAAERDRIWRKAFPADAPLAPDVDVSVLAGRLQIPGGSIQNIALHAAFLAAADGRPIGTAHLLAATRRELVKIGMLTAERSLDEQAV